MSGSLAQALLAEPRSTIRTVAVCALVGPAMVDAMLPGGCMLGFAR